MTDVGQMLREARQSANMTQKDVADRMYVSRSLIAVWETGSRDPRMGDVLRFCDAIGATLTIQEKP